MHDAGVALRIPRPGLCTDNGAMVAALGVTLVEAGVPPSTLDLGADSGLPVTSIAIRPTVTAGGSTAALRGSRDAGDP